MNPLNATIKMDEVSNRDEALVLCKKQGIYALLSKKQGRVDALILKKPAGIVLSPGIKITYVKKGNRGHLIIIEDLVIEDIPFLLARHDIVFLHALLEIIFHHGTLNDDHLFLFSFMEMMYVNSFFWKDKMSIKKRVICYLFVHFSLYPDDPFFSETVAFLSKIPIDKIETIDLQLEQEHVLDVWIMWSIYYYPQGRWMKVLPALLVNTEMKKERAAYEDTQ